jgi:hypothetical protein
MFSVTKAMLTLDERGLIFCKDTVLARANASGQIDFDFHVNRCQKLLTVAYGNNPAETTLLRIANAIETWNQGLHGRAVMKLIHIGLPEPERDDAWNDRLAKTERQIDDESIRNANVHWQLQPRQPKGSPDSTGGEWATDPNAAGVIPVAAHTPVIDPTVAKKQAFVKAHLRDSEVVAKKLNIPVEYILGLAAIESGWGGSRFAYKGNNFFGLHHPALYNNGKMQAEDDPSVFMSTFPDYRTGLQSFSDKFGNLVYGAPNAEAFARSLQNSLKFGVKPDKITHQTVKMPGYVSDMANTIDKLRLYIADER